jgi:hypothetical protein
MFEYVFSRLQNPTPHNRHAYLTVIHTKVSLEGNQITGRNAPRRSFMNAPLGLVSSFPPSSARHARALRRGRLRMTENGGLQVCQYCLKTFACWS